MQHVDYDFFSALLSYHPETGKLYWKHRDEADFPTRLHFLNWKKTKADKEAGCLSDAGYFRIQINGKRYKSHRVAWLLHYGSWPKFGVDHENGNRSDNRIRNLRDVGQSANNKNTKRRSDNKSGVTGVYTFKDRDGYYARIKVNGRVQHLGAFETLEAASEARKLAERKHGFHVNHGRTENKQQPVADQTRVSRQADVGRPASANNRG